MIWKIEQLECAPSNYGPKVFIIHWRINAEDGEHVATVCGAQTITEPLGGPFIPYDQLTEQQVINWVKADMGPEKVAETEAGVLGDLERLKNPPIVVMPFPWAN